MSEHNILEHSTGSFPLQEFNRQVARTFAHYFRAMGKPATAADLEEYADTLLPKPNPGWRLRKETLVNGLLYDIIEPDPS